LLLPNIIGVVKERKCIEDLLVIYDWNSHLKDVGTDGRILIQILKKYDGGLMGLIQLRRGTSGGLL
jgi:hypothetical protein